MISLGAAILFLATVVLLSSPVSGQTQLRRHLHYDNNSTDQEIVGGSVAYNSTTNFSKAFNYYARIELNGKRCGGVLIQNINYPSQPSPWVLTSGKCLEDTFGSFNKNFIVTIQQEGGINSLTQYTAACVVSRNFTNGFVPLNDLVGIVLQAPVPTTVSQGVSVASASYTPTGGENFTFIGMGSTSNTSMTLADKLYGIKEYPYVGMSQCNSTTYYNGNIPPSSYLCAVGSGEGACFSDGGSPLIRTGGYLVGIYTQTSSLCANLTLNTQLNSVQYPDLFVSISDSLDFIANYLVYFENASYCPSPAPTNGPAPTSPAPTNPGPTAPAPTNPAPTNPGPTAPAPTAPSPTPSPGGGGGGFCFSGSSTVQVLGHGTVAMKDLRIGQQVFAGYEYRDGLPVPLYETVYGFGHYQPDEMGHDYLRIHTKITTAPTTTGSEAVTPLEISAAHLIFKSGNDDPVRADSVQVGDVLWYQSTADTTKQPRVISKIETISSLGLYQPLTKDGTIVVNGIHASSYVSIHQNAPTVVELALSWRSSEQELFHWWMAPYRVFCTKVSPQLCVNDYDREEGIIHWLILGRNVAELGHSLPHIWMVIGCILTTLFCGIFMILEAILDGSWLLLLLVGISGSMLTLGTRKYKVNPRVVSSRE